MTTQTTEAQAQAELRDQVAAAIRDAAPQGTRAMADAAIASIAVFAADALDGLSGQIGSIGADEQEYGRALGFEEGSEFLRGLAA